MPYFDHNATTPLSPAAREAWLRVADEHWHNPSSAYRDGAKAKLRLDAAREALATLIEAKPEQIVFTSGSTESANAVLRHLAAISPAETTLIVNPSEHPCVLGSAERLFGPRIVFLDTDENGVVSLERLQQRLAGGRIAAVIAMLANNETGVLQPWRQIAAACRAAGVPYVGDASQWLGKLPAGGLGAIDWIFGAAHKFGGPKGVGFLKMPTAAIDFQSQWGGEQEHGHRGGTENLASISAMLAALAEAERSKVMFETERLRWREVFERDLCIRIPGTQIVAAAADRLWNTVLAILPVAENHRWVAKLDKLGFQVATGSACATGKKTPSHVLASLGVAPEAARRAIRISAGWDTREADWRDLLEALVRVHTELATSNANVVTL